MTRDRRVGRLMSADSHAAEAAERDVGARAWREASEAERVACVERYEARRLRPGAAMDTFLDRIWMRRTA